MHDLIAGAAILPVLIAIIATQAQAVGCRRLPCPPRKGGQP